MGDRNYYPNQYSSFTAQNYGGYSQSQQSPYSQPQQSLSSLFDMKPNQAHSKMPAYNTGSSCSKGQLSDTNYTTQAMRHAQSRETSYSRGDFQQNDSERPPPSYEESRNDILLSRSRKDHNYKKTLIPPKKCSPAWNYIVDLGGREPLPQKRSFSDFFDIPGKKPEGESQRVMEQYSNFSQQHSTSFSSDNRYQSDNSFSHRSDTPAEQVSDLKQFNDNRGFGEQNHKRESGKGEFREHGNRQDSDSQIRGRGKWNEHTDIGKQQAWNRDEFEDNKNTNYPWPDSNVDRIRSVSKDYGNDRSEEGRNEEFNNRYQSDNSFSHRSDTPARQVSDFKQFNDKRGFGEQTHKRESGKGEFREHGNRQDSDSQVRGRGKRNEHTDIGKQQAWNRDEFEDNKNTNYSWPDSNVDRIRSVSKDYGNDRSEEGRHEEFNNRYQSDNSFSHRSDTPARQVSDLKQFNDNRGFGEQTHKRESGKGEFREHGNWQDSDSQVRGRGKWNENTDIGKQQAWNRDEFEDNKNTNYPWPDSNVDRIRSVSKDYGNDRSEEGRNEEFNNRYQSDNSFSRKSDTPARQASDFKQFNDNREFGEQNHKRESGKGEFREHGNWQDSDSQVRERRKCNEHTDIGKQQAWNRDEFEDNKNTNYPWPDLNVDRIRSVSKDYGNDRSEEGRNEELNIQEEGSGDERDEEDANSDGEWEKVNVFHPDHNLQNKYRYYPPTAEEMGEMFRNLIIYFFFKVPKNMRERNPFVVICESFRKSSGYANLEVEDGYEFQNKDRKFCTLRYKGMMMVRGVGDNGNIKEARVWAAVDLINKLAMSCYTLKAKQEYFSVDSFKKQLRSGNVPGIYRFVPPIIALDFETSRAYLMDMFSKQDTDEEQMFSLPDKEGIKLKSWASKNGFDVRVIIKDKWIGICQHRTLQYWRDKILASGSMETAKFVLIPPQGIGNLLMPKYNIKEAVPTLKLHFPKLQKLTVLYGPHGVGPTINKGLVPWERRGGGFRNRNTNKKQKKIMRQLKEGVPLTETKGFKFLSKRKKKQLKNKLGVS